MRQADPAKMTLGLVGDTAVLDQAVGAGHVSDTEEARPDQPADGPPRDRRLGDENCHPAGKQLPRGGELLGDRHAVARVTTDSYTFAAIGATI